MFLNKPEKKVLPFHFTSTVAVCSGVTKPVSLTKHLRIWESVLAFRKGQYIDTSNTSAWQGEAYFRWILSSIEMQWVTTTTC